MPSSPADTPLGGTLASVLFVFGGHATAVLLGFAANIWAMRVLGPEQYGSVAVSLIILFILWQFIGKGLDQSAVRLAASTDHPRGPAAIFETVYAVKIVGGGLLLLLGVVLTGPLTRWLLSPDASQAPIYLAFVGAVGASFWGFHSAAIQAESRFGRYTSVQVANNTIKLLALAVMILSGGLTATTVMIATAAGFFGAAALGGLLAPNYARRPRWVKESVPVIGAYARWLIISSVIFLLYSRLDVLMISRLVGGEMLGVYAAAAVIVQMGDVLAASILTVFLPRFSRHTDTTPLRRQVTSSLQCSLMLVLPLVPCFALIDPVMTFLLGEAYAGAAAFVRIMYFGVLFTTVTHPLHLLFYARGKPHILTGLDVLLLAFNAIALYLAIPRFGALGAAWVVLAARILAGVLLSIGVIIELGIRSQTAGEQAGN